MLKVVKFGGSSLCDAEHFKMAAAIVRADESRRYVVPSAPGKRFGGDIKVTDMLYEFHRLVLALDGRFVSTGYANAITR